jgi:hypothetical protein
METVMVAAALGAWLVFIIYVVAAVALGNSNNLIKKIGKKR